MARNDSGITPPFDVSEKGALYKQSTFLWEKFCMGRPAVTRTEENLLAAAGYDPAQLYLVDRIGDTAVFMRLVPYKPILLHKSGLVKDLNKPTKKSATEEE